MMRQILAGAILAVALAGVGVADAVAPRGKAKVQPFPLAPYTGPSVAGVDTQTLDGKVLCGYQGWFSCPGDGTNMGWAHYAGKGGKFEPGHCSIDLWPDVSELSPAEKYATPFRHADGSVAAVFSSFDPRTVGRHFEWMRRYGIDGVFVQRFAVYALSPASLTRADGVLTYCREAANRNGRAYAVMYDLSGLKEGQIDRVIDDWKRLVDGMKLTRDKNDRAYLHHRGKPVVAIWGVGFNDHRPYTLRDCRRLLEFLKDDPRYGGCTVMLGIPMGWRELSCDSLKDPALHEVLAKADILSPWTVGRYRTPKEARLQESKTYPGDVEWCASRRIDFMPVIFPGFSWYNMSVKRGDASPKFDPISRCKGEFLWTQALEARRAGAKMLYVAMFDEMDEGTAIFKCTGNVPVGESRFLNLEGLPSDHYLWLVGQVTKLMQGRLAATPQAPARPAAQEAGQTESARPNNQR